MHQVLLLKAERMKSMASLNVDDLMLCQKIWRVAKEYLAHGL